MTTTLNPSDVATGGGTNTPTLSNGNLTVAGTNGSGAYVAIRAVDGVTSGSYYFEATCDVQGSNNNGGVQVGLYESTQTLAQSGGTTNAIMWFNNTGVSINGASVATLGNWRTAGSTISVAFTVGGNFWGRLGSGDWNLNPTADPATNTGGIDISALTGTIMPAFWENPFSGSPTQVTFNFGGTAFAETMPTGFFALGPTSIGISGVASVSAIGALDITSGLEMIGVQATTAVSPVFVMTGPNITNATVTGVSAAVDVGTVGWEGGFPLTGVQASTGIGPLAAYSFVDGFTLKNLTVDAIPSALGADTGVTMRYSNTGGQSWSNPVTRSLGLAGQYSTNLSWRNLGQSRNMVFEISWSCPFKTSLGGGTVQVEVSGT